MDKDGVAGFLFVCHFDVAILVSGSSFSILIQILSILLESCKPFGLSIYLHEAILKLKKTIIVNSAVKLMDGLLVHRVTPSSQN